MTPLLGQASALLPVLVFLGILFGLDSFKLVRRRALAGAILVGGAAALAVLLLHRLLPLEFLPSSAVSRYVAPVTEEAPISQEAPAPQATTAVQAELERLRRLRDEGVIVDAEYEQLRESVLKGQ